MVKQNRDPKSIALWRHDQIEPALHEDLLAEGRGRLLKQISKSSVLWPSGEVKPVSLPTLYRWLEQFEQEGLEGLKPEVRSDRGQVHRAFHPDLVESAIKHLSEDPTQSLYFLIKVLEAELDDEQLIRVNYFFHCATIISFIRRQVSDRRRRPRVDMVMVQGSLTKLFVYYVLLGEKEAMSAQYESG
jgi:hypothetical protein